SAPAGRVRWLRNCGARRDWTTDHDQSRAHPGRSFCSVFWPANRNAVPCVVHAVSGCNPSRATRPLGHRGKGHTRFPLQDDHRVGARHYQWRPGAGGRGRYRANDAYAALGTGCRRVDRAVHRHAGTVVAERISSHRLWRAEGDGRERPASCAGACRRGGTTARICSYSLVEFTGDSRSMTYYSYTEGPSGRMLFTADGHALTGMYFVGQKHEATPRSDWVEEDHVPLFVA